MPESDSEMKRTEESVDRLLAMQREIEQHFLAARLAEAARRAEAARQAAKK